MTKELKLEELSDTRTRTQFGDRTDLLFSPKKKFKTHDKDPFSFADGPTTKSKKSKKPFEAVFFWIKWPKEM